MLKTSGDASDAATRTKLVECFGVGRRCVVKRAIFDIFRSGQKIELSHYTSTAQLLNCGKAIQ